MFLLPLRQLSKPEPGALGRVPDLANKLGAWLAEQRATVINAVDAGDSAPAATSEPVSTVPQPASPAPKPAKSKNVPKFNSPPSRTPADVFSPIASRRKSRASKTVGKMITTQHIKELSSLAVPRAPAAKPKVRPQRGSKKSAAKPSKPRPADKENAVAPMDLTLDDAPVSAKTQRAALKEIVKSAPKVG